MRIAHVDYNFTFELNENDRGILVVENAKTFRTIVSQLRHSLIDKEEIFIFSENNKVIKAWEKIDLIINPMEIEINSKKLIGRLYDKMREEVNETDLLIDNNMLFQNIEGFFLHIADNFDFDLTYKDKIELADILKMLDVKIVEEYNDQIEKIVEYMRAFSLLFGINYFIFINLNTFFDNYEIEKIYEFAEYNKINIFLVENRQPDFIANYTQIKIIDKDNCEISFNM